MVAHFNKLEVYLHMERMTTHTTQKIRGTYQEMLCQNCGLLLQHVNWIEPVLVQHLAHEHLPISAVNCVDLTYILKCFEFCLKYQMHSVNK